MNSVFVDDNTYLPKIVNMLTTVETEEMKGIEAAAKAAYTSICNGGLLHVFSCGHSHMIVDEMFYRAGGLVPVNPILDSQLMMHEGAIQSTLNERKTGKAREVLSKANLKAGDTIIVSSNTGINNVPIEAAIYAKEKGLTVIVITSISASKMLEANNESGKRLYDLGDIVIDNHVPFGDGLLTIPENGQTTGEPPLSAAFSLLRESSLK